MHEPHSAADPAPNPSRPASPGQADLPRVLGAWSAASILIGAIIGSGVFVKPRGIAEALPAPGWILAAWAAAGFLALIGSLVFAELGSRFPGPGGQYGYLRESFGRLPAFLFGWTNLTIINSASIAALAVISAQYAFNLLPAEWQPAAGSHWFQSLPVLLILALTLANIAGVRWGAGIQNTLTICKLAALAVIISGVFFSPHADWSRLSPFWEMRGTPGGAGGGDIWGGVKLAFLAIFWAYDGWYLLSFSGGEIRNPRRNIPVGFVLGIIVVIAVYMVANVAYMCAIDLESMKSIDRNGGVGAEAAERFYGKLGLLLVSFGIVGSTAGAANANLLTGPRLSFAMARDGLFFPRFGTVHPRFLTPAFAIAVQGVIGALYVYAGSFDQLTDSVVYAAWIFYFLTVLGVFRLRRRAPASGDVFLAPGHPWLPLLFVAFAGVFIAYSFTGSFSLSWRYLQGDTQAADGLYPILVVVIISLGLPLYAFLRRRRPA